MYATWDKTVAVIWNFATVNMEIEWTMERIFAYYFISNVIFFSNSNFFYKFPCPVKFSSLILLNIAYNMSIIQENKEYIYVIQIIRGSY